MKNFRSNGKLLLIGEYIVIDGAKAFALPTKFGQCLSVDLDSKHNNTISWVAKKYDNSIWFETTFELNTLDVKHTSQPELSKSLQKILIQAKSLKPEFFNTDLGYFCETKLEYPQEWGLGSSSTLIDLICQWIGIDPFLLNELTFNTSGYDIACAHHSYPILFSNSPIKIEKIILEWDFLDDLYFVYLNKKQNTQAVVSNHYKNKEKNIDLINYLSHLVIDTPKVKSLNQLENILDEYQTLLGSFMIQPKVKDLYFQDYDGCVKSLGAWGGDFILVTKREGFKEYFNEKGYELIIPFREMIL